MTTHVKVLGWFFIVFGAFYVLLAFGSSMILGFLAAMVGREGGEDAAVGASALGLAGAAAFVFWLVIGIPGVITGIGLLKMRPWARIVGIVLSALRLIEVPFGTVLGVYGLWVLFNKDTEALFNGTTAPAPSTPTTL